VQNARERTTDSAAARVTRMRYERNKRAAEKENWREGRKAPRRAVPPQAYRQVRSSDALRVREVYAVPSSQKGVKGSGHMVR